MYNVLQYVQCTYTTCTYTTCYVYTLHNAYVCITIVYHYKHTADIGHYTLYMHNEKCTLQEGVDWAMYLGISFVILSFLIAVVAPDVRGFFRCFHPKNIRSKFR